MAQLAVVTGASSGIGAAYAERLAADGWEVVAVARRRDRLEELAARLSSAHGATVRVVEADLSRREDLVHLCDELARLPVHMLVNNAGLAHYMPFGDLPTGTIDELVDLDLLAPLQLTRAVLPGMQTRGGGAIINIASLLAFSGAWEAPFLPARAVYSAAKASLVTFSQILSAELRDQGVRVQVCCPGIVRTEFHTRQGMDMSGAPRMEPDAVVEASLHDLDHGVVVSIPGIADPARFAAVVAAMGALMGGTRAAELPARYRD
ncbi:MAG TPA: SDR family NAD(P)-dependent oxidoreductase [Candidatus Dormibacteraeota bacterium]|jgi:short-subunit dehydrogenase